MKPAPFEYHRPASLAETFDLLDRYGDDGRILAGGQSLVPALNLRLATPRAIIDRLNTEFVRILNTPDVKETLLKQGLEVSTSTPAAFGVYMKAEFDKWGRVIRDAGIVAN